MFSTNTLSKANSAQDTLPYKQVSPFRIAEDKENRDASPSPRHKSPNRINKKVVDSGYHDMTEEEENMMSLDTAPVMLEPPTTGSLFNTLQNLGLTSQPVSSRHQSPERNSEQSFVSAKEVASNVSRSQLTSQTTQASPRSDERDVDFITAPVVAPVLQNVLQPSAQYSVTTQEEMDFDIARQEIEANSPVRAIVAQPDPSPAASVTSTPDRPDLRKKSSLNFASLPAREPLTTKKSTETTALNSGAVDAVNSLSDDINDGTANTGLISQQVKISTENDTLMKESADLEDQDDPIKTNHESHACMMHNKTSTQKLHERITMLGQSNHNRLTKSIPSAASALSQKTKNYCAEEAMPNAASTIVEDNDDDWIGPISSSAWLQSQTKDIDQGTPAEPHVPIASFVESQVTSLDANMPSMSKTPQSRTPWLVKASYPELPKPAVESTTPAGSPSLKRNMDGPISASKAKFNSLLKSAKGIFGNSTAAGTSVKIDNQFSASTLARAEKILRENDSEFKPTDANREIQLPDKIDEVKPAELSDARRSSQRLRQQAAGISQDIERIVNHISIPEHSDRSRDEDATRLTRDEQSSKCPAKSHVSSIAFQKQAEPRRPPKTTEKPAAKTKPAPMSIRTASQQIGRFAPNASAGPTSQDETSVATAAIAGAPEHSIKRPAMIKKGSNSSLRAVTSSQTLRSVAPAATGRLRALDAAAKKKEQNEKETQRKAEQRRDLERRKAAKVEEERRQVQESKLAEQHRALEAKNIALKLAEQRKAEVNRRHEQQQRSQHAQASIRGVEEQSFANNQQKEPSLLRPASRMTNAQQQDSQSRPALPHINPAKPPKRYFQPDEDDEQSRHAVQDSQHGPKRRRTSDDFHDELPARPTMAPPVRLSNMRKDVPSKFAHGFMNASAASAGQSMLKSAVNASHSYAHPKTPHMNDLAKFSNARIPFAEAPNPPQNHAQPQRVQQGAMKTPKTIQKSSPQYPNGDAIELPDIATDSEDSDDDNDGGFVPPDWANSPALRALLSEQQLIDPMNVFGPIGPLSMEEIFKGSKERQAKFRARTSSANWNGPDRLTEEERRKDREAREKLQREGAWTYGTST